MHKERQLNYGRKPSTYRLNVSTKNNIKFILDLHKTAEQTLI